jgi:hypothetical protein
MIWILRGAVLVKMTRNTLRRYPAILIVNMTSQTIDRFMSAPGREFCEVVIKTIAPGDCILPMTCEAIGREARRPVVDRRRIVEVLAVT